ncbi:MAG: sodium-dependent bicarbonate transport family permease, partial [Rhodoferax sp.]|nr:sodium-dependent bicarbonate transport family permease [Rhodoferax sp.]
VVLANRVRQQASAGGTSQPLGRILHESLTDGAQLLLLGAMLVGLFTGVSGQKALQPFAVDLFKGMLAFFLLDMGLSAARNMGSLRGKSALVLVYAIAAPLVHAGMALALALMFGLSAGDGGLLMVLAASASYIAVPAVVRHAIPEANPSLFIGMSLGLTFPFNILFGIPLYVGIATSVLGG